MIPLEQWLSAATRGLSPESSARVRAEIQQHYDSAREAGDDPIAALGDPKAANRAYRKVLLTKWEATMAPSITRSKRFNPVMLLGTALYAALITWLGMGMKHHDPGFVPIMIAICFDSPFNWFFLRNTIKRIHIYLYVEGANRILVVALAAWYQGWVGALVYGAMMTVLFWPLFYLANRNLLVLRKLAAGQTYSRG